MHASEQLDLARSSVARYVSQSGRSKNMHCEKSDAGMLFLSQSICVGERVSERA